MKIKNNKYLKSSNRFPLTLFIIFMILETCIFLLTKVISINAEGNNIQYYISIITEPWVWITLLIALIQLFLWRKLLSKSDLSFVYSLSSLSYPLTMLLANYIFKENLPLFVWIGGGLISMGVLLVGFGSSGDN